MRAPMTRAVLSLGSNLGDRSAHLQSAVDGLGAVVLAVSPVYQTAPWGPVAQDDYLNAVLLVEDDSADGAEWLRRAQRLEQRAGRTRSVRFGPRTLDVDVITVDAVVSADPQLTLPHPRAHERAFVLVPWLAVEPDAVLPRPGIGADVPSQPVSRPGADRADGRGGVSVAAAGVDRDANAGADGDADAGAERGPTGVAGCGAVRGADAGEADAAVDRVAELVARLPSAERAGVRRRDDLRLRRPASSSAVASPASSSAAVSPASSSAASSPKLSSAAASAAASSAASSSAAKSSRSAGGSTS